MRMALQAFLEHYKGTWRNQQTGLMDDTLLFQMFARMLNKRTHFGMERCLEVIEKAVSDSYVEPMENGGSRVCLRFPGTDIGIEGVEVELAPIPYPNHFQ